MSATAQTSVDLELLRSFCGEKWPWMKTLFNVWNFRGGSAVNHDLCATNGQIFLCVHQQHDPESQDYSPHLPVTWWWAMSAIDYGDDEVFPARQCTIDRVPESIREQLNRLPGVEFKEVPRVKIWVHGNGKPKQQFRDVEAGAIVFFKFTGGTGFCAAKEAQGSEVAA